MKRLLCIFALVAFSFSLYAAVGAVSASKGPVITEITPGSPEDLLLAAFSSSFSEEWIDAYLIDTSLFRASYTSHLALILPLENILLFKSSDFYTLYSQKNGITVSVKLDGMKICEILFSA